MIKLTSPFTNLMVSLSWVFSDHVPAIKQILCFLQKLDDMQMLFRNKTYMQAQLMI